jgi:hypothetical protein
MAVSCFIETHGKRVRNAVDTLSLIFKKCILYKQKMYNGFGMIFFDMIIKSKNHFITAANVLISGYGMEVEMHNKKAKAMYRLKPIP